MRFFKKLKHKGIQISMNGRKHLTDRGITPFSNKYPPAWSPREWVRRFIQNRRYGFPYSDSFALDIAMAELILERLIQLHQDSGEMINWDYHKIEFEGTVYTTREILDLLIDCFEKGLLLNEDTGENYNSFLSKGWKLWAETYPYWWW